MHTALALVAAHPFAHGWGWGFAPLAFVLIPLFWIGIIVLIVSLARRRWRRSGPGWGGPWAGQGGPNGWASWHAARTAESTLAERFAQGDIDEVEYRARLEVLRANGMPAAPPQG